MDASWTPLNIFYCIPLLRPLMHPHRPSLRPSLPFVHPVVHPLVHPLVLPAVSIHTPRYARQSRKMADNVPIVSADIAKMLEHMGVDSIFTIDLHEPEIKGFFRVPVVHVASTSIGAAYFAEKSLDQPVVVSPKTGGVVRAQQFMLSMIDHGHPDATLATLVRSNHSGMGGKAETKVVGNVRGRDCILVDDMIDTAKTTCRATRLLQKVSSIVPLQFSWDGDVAHAHAHVRTRTCVIKPVAYY